MTDQSCGVHKWGQVLNYQFSCGASRTTSHAGLAIIEHRLDTMNCHLPICVFNPYAVDVSSGVEQSPGLKDDRLVQAFCHAMHKSL